MLNYKHIIFDFGNVLATFDPDIILAQLHAPKKDLPLLKKVIFDNWDALDNGTLSYEEVAQLAIHHVPAHLKDVTARFFTDWYKYLPPLSDTWELVRELKAKGASLYILSNAPTYFAEKADFYEITAEFDGIVFSGPLVLSKPDPRFYQYLFDNYHLEPSDCFFIDDKPENINAGKALGMNGIIFDGDISKVRREIGL